MKVLLIGGGGREHALGWKIAQSPELSKLYLAPGSPGLNPFGEAVSIADSDPAAIADFASENAIDLVVVGPEAPLAAGLGDAVRAKGIACFGPDREAAQLETSKSYMKDVCAAAGAPTAAYGKFTKAEDAKAFLREQSAPYVVKADGLAAGKGVIIAETLADADAAVDDILGGRFGEAGAALVIEEFLEGEEASFFAITDGETILPMIGAQDHKRAHDGDKGPNTGGMGAYSPAPVFTDAVRQRTMDEIVTPVVKEMARRGAPYVGVIYAGLMIKDGAPRLIEINARFGDPECQILMRRLRSDFLPILYAAATGALAGHTLDWSDDAAALVVMAAKGYPGAYEKGSPIKGVERAHAVDDVVIFHAGTREENGQLFSNGGRVLNITATGATIRDAIERAYAGVDAIDWPGGFYRKDIGWRALGAQNVKPLDQWRKQARFFEANGYRFAYWTTRKPADAKPWLLLVHGFPTSSWDWTATWARLEERFNLAAMDMLGFGLSDKPANISYSMMHQADLQEALLARLGVSEAHILAHDYGDTVAQELLARHNDRALSFSIKSICFLNGGLFPEQHRPRPMQKIGLTPLGPIIGMLLTRDKLRKAFDEIFGQHTKASEEEIDGHWSLFEENNGRRVFHKLLRYIPERQANRPRWVGALTDAHIPMRLIDGGADPVSGKHLYDYYKEMIPNADAVLLEDIGHYPQTEAPERVLKAFFDFHRQPGAHVA